MGTNIQLSSLSQALQLDRSGLVSIVGGGGKTTVMFALGHQLGGRRILTTTTKMGSDRTGGFPTLVDPDDRDLRIGVDPASCVLVWRALRNSKAIGFEPERCERFLGLADHVLVEADGSAGRPFKAPKPFEPVVPASTTVLIACIGADALGRVIADRCHRPLRVAAIAGCSPYQRLTPLHAAKVLLDPSGSRKDCPKSARFIVLVNAVRAETAAAVEELVGEIGTAAEVVTIGFDPDAAAPGDRH